MNLAEERKDEMAEAEEEEKEEKSEELRERQQKKTLVFDAEIPVSPLAEKRGGRGGDERKVRRVGRR